VSSGYRFVPPWAIDVYFTYAPRRCDCSRCGVKVELLPWSNGKSPITTAFTWFSGIMGEDIQLEGNGAAVRGQLGRGVRRGPSSRRVGEEPRSLDGIEAIPAAALSSKSSASRMYRRTTLTER
jgi:hypothetical protein